MKIQIAPKIEDCEIVNNRVKGKMDGRTMVFEIPSEYRIEKGAEAWIIGAFRTAIALSSKSWQVEDALNAHLCIKGGKFYFE